VKYLIIVFMMICSLSLFGQTKDSIVVASKEKDNRSSWILASGIGVNSFKVKLLQLTYLYGLNNRIVFPFEFELLFNKSENLPLGSTSVRIYQHIFQETEIYLQAGLSIVIGGVESLAFIPLLNCGFGVQYNKINIEMRTMIVDISELNNLIPLFLSVGVNI